MGSQPQGYEHASASFAWRADAAILRVEVDSDLKAAYDEVRSGKGVVLVRGLPVNGTLEQFSAAVWEIGRHFGAALSQNAQGELIGHVIDATAGRSDAAHVPQQPRAAAPQRHHRHDRARVLAEGALRAAPRCW